MRIALAAAPSRFGDQIAELLRLQARELLSMQDSADAVARLRSAAPDLLVVVEPFFDGGLTGFLKALRADPSLKPLPVLCISQRGLGDSGVSWLEAGADDCIDKPFNPQVFLARLRSLMRRGVWAGRIPEQVVTALSSGGLAVHMLQRQVTLDGQPVPLTRLEFDLLGYLMRAPGRAHRREQLLEAVWNYPTDVATRTLDKHVEMLRRKLGRYGAAIETVHGVGYRFVELPSPKRRSGV